MLNECIENTNDFKGMCFAMIDIFSKDGQPVEPEKIKGYFLKMP